MNATHILQTAAFSLVLGLTACSGSGASDNQAGDSETTEGALAVGDLQGAERSAFLDAVRAVFQSQVGKGAPEVQFVVKKLNVATGKDGARYGFLQAEPQVKGTGAAYPKRDSEDDGVTTYAVMRTVAGKWTPVGVWIGPTDVAWEEMPCSDGVPASILGQQEPDCRAYLGWAGKYTQVISHGSASLTVKREHPLTIDIAKAQGVDDRTDIAVKDLIIEATADNDPYVVDTQTIKRADCTITLVRNPQDRSIEVTQTGTCRSIGFPADAELGGRFDRD